MSREITQRELINDNIIKQYEIRVQQDIKRIDRLESALKEIHSELSKIQVLGALGEKLMDITAKALY